MSRSENKTLSVTQALELVDSSLSEFVFAIEGELCDISSSGNYKAIYFSLKDENSYMRCLMWKFGSCWQNFDWVEGLNVKVVGTFSIYSKKGSFTFKAIEIEKIGEGSLRQKVAKRIEKFYSQGLLNPSLKKEIPQYPKRIGLITSGSGAAIHDVLRTFRRRTNFCKIAFCGVKVEGASAVEEMTDALQLLQKNSDVDIILLVRGGGSYEDLMPFNDETLCMEIVNCNVPIITGIGHESDNTLADMVADLRCSTPTAAAEVATQSLFDLPDVLNGLSYDLNESIKAVFSNLCGQVESLSVDLQTLSPKNVIKTRWLEIDHIEGLFLEIGKKIYVDNLSRFEILASQLEALSPLNVFDRGYSCLMDASHALIKSAYQVKEGDTVVSMLMDGKLTCEVKEISNDKPFTKLV